MKIRFFALAALALTLAACNNNEDPYDNGSLPEGKYPVVIRATGLSVTETPASRATVDGNWEGVTSVAVMMDGTVKEYSVAASADNTNATLSRENAPFWWTSRDPITVTAWWPYTEGETALPDVVVNEDQSTQEAFAASDFISAENQTVEFDDPLLTFTHRTARVIVELTPGTGFSSVADATVSLTRLSTLNGNPSAITTCNTSDNSYEALTAPQTVAANESFIQVELNGSTYSFRPQDDVVLEAGYRYVYTIKVNATGLTLEGCEIGDWADGGIQNGDAGELNYIFNEETNTYTVYTANGLIHVARLANCGELGMNITLAADIDLTGREWIPIGSFDNPFTGTFEGNNNTITGLTANMSEVVNAGLIGGLGSDGKVQNLTLENVNITGSGLANVGGVAGSNSGTVIACTVSGSVSGAGLAYVGGVVGINRGFVTACTVSGSVSGSVMDTAPNFGYSYVGGVVGGAFDGSVVACYHVSGSISGITTDGLPSHVGGVVGTNNSSIVTACYNASSESITGSNVGGVVGENISGGTVTACYWSNYDGNGIGKDDAGTGETTQVTDGNWTNAVGSMNDAINNWNNEHPDNRCDWRYELTGDNELPTLKKQ